MIEGGGNMLHKVPENIINELVVKYQHGFTVKELVDEYNITRDTIVKYLKLNNVFKPKTHNWSKEMDDKLREIYPSGDWDLILNTFPNRSRSFIYTRASKLGLHIDNYFWSQHDKDILIKYYNVIPTEEIQKMLDKEYKIRTIQNQAKKLGLTQSPYWTTEEIDIMNEKYASLGAMGIMEFLPNKTYYAIIGKAVAMGLRCDIFWTEDEKQFVIDNWESMSDAEMGEVLNRPMSGVMEQRHKLGLYYDLGYNGYYTIINYLRMNITEWKKKSMAYCNYKCVLSGNPFDDIHHKYSFNLILKETLDTIDIDDRESIDDYTDEELTNILNTFRSVQDSYPLGVCLSRDVHKLFHKIYGYGDNTIEQWDEFEQNYKNGLYKH
jgi:hypothetical protein